MEGQRDRLPRGQLHVLGRVELGHHGLGQGQLLGVEVGGLGAQGVVHDQPLAHPLHGLVDVVHDRDDGGGGHPGAQLPGSAPEDALNEGQALQRDPGDHLGHGLGVVGRDVAAVDERGVHVLAGPAPEAEAAAGEDGLTPDLVARQYDVVVEDPQDHHALIVPRITRKSSWERPFFAGPGAAGRGARAVEVGQDRTRQGLPDAPDPGEVLHAGTA